MYLLIKLAQEINTLRKTHTSATFFSGLSLIQVVMGSLYINSTHTLEESPEPFPITTNVTTFIYIYLIFQESQFHKGPRGRSRCK
jgi:hypothetical protein